VPRRVHERARRPDHAVSRHTDVITGDTLCKSTNVVQRLDTELAQQFLQQYI
jgi:hypothetical protein